MPLVTADETERDGYVPNVTYSCGALAHAGQLIVPFGQDQPDNVRRCAALGVARTLPRAAFRADRVAAELRALLQEPGFARRAADVGRTVREEDGVRVACDSLEHDLRRA